MAESRRSSVESLTSRQVAFAQYRFNPGTGELWRGDKEIKLTPRAATLLAALAERATLVVTKQELIARAWEGRAVGDDALTSCVQELRRALGDDPRQPQLIETRHRRGYRLLVPVSAADPMVKNDSAPEPAAPLPLPDEPSIAVLPFQNMSGDPEQEYFADGMVEEIITALSRVRSLFVIARNSSFTYKGKAVDIRQVGRELGVRYVLEGSVRKAGNRIRITTELADAAKGGHLWADHFDGALEDVFELQDRVTASVVGVIAPRIEQAEIERARRKPAGNLEAYDLALRALALMQSPRRPENEQALSLLRRAVQIDPSYARGTASLSFCCQIFISQGFGHRDSPLVADMTELARRAVALDPADPYVLTLAASVLGLGSDMDTGLALVAKAIDLNRNNAGAFSVGATLYAYQGEVEKAIEHQQQCERLNPLGTRWGGNVAYAIAYFGVGDHEKVVDWTARILRERPNAAPAMRYRAASLALLGRAEEARQVVVRLLEHAPGYSISEVRRHHEFDMNSPFKKPGVTEALYRGLRLAGLPE